MKKRLDQRVLEQHPDLTRNQVQSWIMQGKVSVDGAVMTKAGSQIREDQIIELVIEKQQYVCRAGWKLQAALDAWDIAVTDKVVLDAGLSTGGFTDCLLQRGAKKIYGVDVGYGQVHESIRHDQRVVVMERTNLRHLTSLPEHVDMVTLDLSFISVIKVLDTLERVMKPDSELVTLIKPQFEAQRGQVPRGGVIRDIAVRDALVKRAIQTIQEHGFMHHGTITSPISGTKGNIEFLAYFTRQ
jgi:23S rRNA (cytidine1920-2'-O)/16S rRNA (cytidine1409-2'-O)-methyltransferase